MYKDRSETDQHELIERGTPKRAVETEAGKEKGGTKKEQTGRGGARVVSSRADTVADQMTCPDYIPAGDTHLSDDLHVVVLYGPLPEAVGQADQADQRPHARLLGTLLVEGEPRRDHRVRRQEILGRLPHPPGRVQSVKSRS
jgi:hypothetical protein